MTEPSKTPRTDAAIAEGGGDAYLTLQCVMRVARELEVSLSYGKRDELDARVALQARINALEEERAYQRDVGVGCNLYVSDPVLAVGLLRERALDRIRRAGQRQREMNDATVVVSLVFNPAEFDALCGLHSQGLPHAEQRYRDGLDEALGKVYAAASVNDAAIGIRELMAAHGRRFPAQCNPQEPKS